MVQVVCAVGLNSKSIRMYKQKVHMNKGTHSLIHQKIFLRSYFPRFGTTPSFSMKVTQSFAHEAPDSICT